MFIFSSKPLSKMRAEASMKKMERYVTELEIDMLELENNETDNEIRIMELEEKING